MKFVLIYLVFCHTTYMKGDDTTRFVENRSGWSGPPIHDLSVSVAKIITFWSHFIHPFINCSFIISNLLIQFMISYFLCYLFYLTFGLFFKLSRCYGKHHSRESN